MSKTADLPEPYRTEVLDWARHVVQQKFADVSDFAYACDVLENIGSDEEKVAARRFLASTPAHNCKMLAAMNGDTPRSLLIPIVIIGGVSFLLACLIGWGFEAVWTAYNAAVLGNY